MGGRPLRPAAALALNHSDEPQFPQLPHELGAELELGLGQAGRPMDVAGCGSSHQLVGLGLRPGDTLQCDGRLLGGGGGVVKEGGEGREEEKERVVQVREGPVEATGRGSPGPKGRGAGWRGAGHGVMGGCERKKDGCSAF
jgi:hypothetical protein